MPSGDRFKLLIEAKTAEVLRAHQKAVAGDINRHEYLKGQYQGLQEALEIYRKAHKPGELEDED